MEEIKLGSKMRLVYLPFTDLIDPEEFLRFGRYQKQTIETVIPPNARPLGTIKKNDLLALVASIGKYGLLNPLSVMKWKDKYHEEIVKYALIDGQRRYYAIGYILRKTFFDKIQEFVNEKRKGESIYFPSSEMEIQGIRQDAEKEYFSKVLIPCIIYDDYTELKQAMRHSVEDSVFSIRPSSEYLYYAERKESDEQ